MVIFHFPSFLLTLISWNSNIFVVISHVAQIVPDLATGNSCNLDSSLLLTCLSSFVLFCGGLIEDKPIVTLVLEGLVVFNTILIPWHYKMIQDDLNFLLQP